MVGNGKLMSNLGPLAFVLFLKCTVYHFFKVFKFSFGFGIRDTSYILRIGEISSFLAFVARGQS